MDEEITDEEAVRLIQQSGGGGVGDGDSSAKETKEEEDHWRQSDSGDAQALTFDDSQTHSQNTDDPFTANLMNFYVSSLTFASYSLSCYGMK